MVFKLLLCHVQVPDVNNPEEKKEDREFVTFDGPVDSVYLDAPDRIVLEVGTGEPDCTLWPWITARQYICWWFPCRCTMLIIKTVCPSRCLQSQACHVQLTSRNEHFKLKWNAAQGIFNSKCLVTVIETVGEAITWWWVSSSNWSLCVASDIWAHNTK